MRRILARTILSATLSLVPVAAIAGLSLSPIMQSWSRDQRDIKAMLGGQRPYDQTELRLDVQRYMASAALVARNLRSGTPEARDFSARFRGFAADSRSALDNVGQPAAFRTTFTRLIGDCQSCHDIYNN